MNNLNSIVDYLKVFNNINKRPAYEPRTMAQGGRIRFGDGSITQVRNKSKNVVGENLRLFNQDKLYHLRLGLDKKNYYGSKEKLENIFKKRKTSGGDVTQVLETKTYKKGWKTKKQFLEFLKKNHIAGENAGSFAGNFGINTKPNPYNKNAYIYDTSQFTPEKITEIYKAQVKSGSATDHAKKLYPPKEKYEYTKKRYLAEKEAGGVKDSGWEGKRGSGVELGHGDDFWAHRKITPQNLLYTPTEINKLLGDKGMLDDKIYAVYEKQEKGKLTKKGDDLKNFLNETDATLTRLADQSGGFKQITLSNGGIYGGDKFSVDMFDEFKGMSQKEAVQFVNKWKDEKTWNTAEEFNNIKKAKLFEINRKNAYKAALKMSQKDKTKIMDKIKGGDFNKFLKQAGFNIDKCLSSGGRVKLGGGGGVNTCIRGVIEAEQKAAKGGSKIAKAKFGKLASKAGWLLGWADIPIELAFALPHMLQGDKEAAKRATTFGLFGWGEKKLDEIKADSPEAYKYAKHIKDNNDWIDSWFTAQDTTEELKTLKEGTGAQELALSQLNKANDKMAKIQEEYVGYVDEEGKFDPLVGAKGKTALQDYLREDVKKKADVGMPIRLEPFSDVPYSLAPYKGGDPITNTKQYIEQKGEPYWKSGLEYAAEEAGVPDLYDTFMQGADTKDPRDIYSELPLEYTSGLGNLEKQEMLEGLKRKGKFMTRGFKDELEAQGIDWKEAYDTGRAEGGIMNLKKK